MKSSILKGLATLWITFSVLTYPQGMWISAAQIENGDSLIKEMKIREKNECIEIDVSYPNINEKEGETLNKEIRDYTNNWLKEVKDGLEEYKKSGYICNMPYQMFSKYSVTKESEDIISFYTDYYQFTGGAHGITTRKAYVVERKDGKILALKDLFKKGYNYKEVIDKEIKIQIAKDKEKYFDDGKTYKGINENVKFYVRGDNLVIYYSQYEIAPYASGIPEFNISMKLFDGNILYD
ncbi:DUF3298 and DUF4163 domain-containing protein [Clostridium sp.]|uniref:DUF3298 and DUF4163 domain-containing protein n=1 Tax=Clostridium sp. TaxID=1506 RepID=UPI002FC8EA30